MSDHIGRLKALYHTRFNRFPLQVSALPRSGSPRMYYRLVGEDGSVIGVYNADVEENKTFIYLTRHFASKGLNVPELVAQSEDEQYYLLSDLGDNTLLSVMTCLPTDQRMALLRDALRELVRFQTDGAENLDFRRCYPVTGFDRRSVMWDLNYFKYSFLKPFGIAFNESKLEDDFETLADFLLHDDMNYFHYRDFQSRNIMVNGDRLFFIDYQGGRRGPCLYDVASLLFQAKAGIEPHQRETLFEFYLDELSLNRSIERDTLRKRFGAFAFFRIIQTLGAYGFRGFFERKSHFMQSIPLALSNLHFLIENDQIGITVSYLKDILNAVLENHARLYEQNRYVEGLTIEVSSFSFRNGYPASHPEHGGGFVFDCRLLPNPGRLNQYKPLTGLDEPVAKYLDGRAEVEEFIGGALDLITKAINSYRQRGFEYLSVAFGCTGGQHRSVYCANRMANALRRIDGINVNIHHRELAEM